MHSIVFRPSSTAMEGMTHEIRGDALLAEFGRASDSVCAALAFQRENSIFNTELDDEIQPEVRIGISLGEVVIADGTITGVGVVLAQRLEQLSRPNGVVVQATVSETVPVRLPFVYESLGEQKLKGFDQVTRAYSVQTKPGESVPEPDSDDVAQSVATQLQKASMRKTQPETGKPSLAVLPFDNMSEDPNQSYFSDGITEDIITDLSKISSIFVVARSSSFNYKGHSETSRKICAELGVRYIVEGQRPQIRKQGPHHRPVD